MSNRYSLANYILSIKPNDSTISSIVNNVITIGGEGSYTDNITINRTNNNIFNTTGFATGGWVHDKNLSKIGTATISLSQLSDSVIRFIRMCEAYYEGDYEGCTITLTDSNGKLICTCNDCYPSNIPEQAFAATSGNQSWIFTCGQINFNA